MVAYFFLGHPVYDVEICKVAFNNYVKHLWGQFYTKTHPFYVVTLWPGEVYGMHLT